MKPIFVVFALVGLACADDFTLTDGTEYKDVRVRRADPDGLVLVTADGIVKAPFSKLPAAVQKQYNYDPAAAGKFVSETNAKAAEAERTASTMAAKADSETKRQTSTKEQVAAAMEVKLTVTSVMDGGFLAHGYKLDPYGSDTAFSDDIYVAGEIPGLVDNARVNATVAPAGTKKFTTVMGAERTVAKFKLLSVREVKTTESIPTGVSSMRRIGGG